MKNETREGGQDQTLTTYENSKMPTNLVSVWVYSSEK